MLLHDCPLITALFSVLLLTAASDSSGSIPALNINQMLALLGSVGYADQLFALDSSCAHPRGAVKLNTCSVAVCVPATAGTCLQAPAVRAYQVVGHTGVPEVRSHEWLHLGASHGAGGDARCPSETGCQDAVPWGPCVSPGLAGTRASARL